MDRRTLPMATGLGATSRAASAEDECIAAGGGASAYRFPQHALVFDQYGAKHRFYTDLVQHKRVMIHFMSTGLEQDFHTAQKLAQLQTHLGASLGRSVFLYSVTVDPQVDTVAVLADYARQFRPQRGWSFLTGYPAHLEAIRDSLFYVPSTDSSVQHGAHTPGEDCSLGLIRYGNDATDLWGSVPTRSDSRWLAARLQWIDHEAAAANAASGRSAGPRRRGPPPVGSGVSNVEQSS